MCITPNTLRNGVSVACHKCWQCRENRVNDWVGRVIAEKNTATASNAVTLTYGKDMTNGATLHERAAVLTYSDLQKYFKRLRFHGYPCRYFAAGEYGSMKGRAHWHVIIFWLGPVPEHKECERFMQEHWPHGWSYWEQPNHAAIRYVCKYLQKDIGKDERQAHLAMSKKPPLGAAYFDQLAKRYAENGLSPQDAFYSFDDARDAKGKKVRFFLKGVSLDNYCAAFLRHWRELHGDRHPPQSQLIEDYCDRVADYDPDPVARPFTATAKPWVEPPAGYVMEFAESLNTYTAKRGSDRLFWSFNLEGERAWQSVIRTEASVQRQQSLITQTAAQYRLASGR